jgi:hypothetical protein
MNAITLTVDAVRLSLLSVDKNKVIYCVPPDANWECSICSLKSKLAFKPTKTSFIATEAVFNVQNASGTPWKIPGSAWELIDCDGFAYHVYSYCPSLQPPRMMVPGSWTVTSGTQVNFALLFPEIETEKWIACILLLAGGVHAFQIADMRPEAKELLAAKIGARENQLIHNDLALQALHIKIDRLEAMMYSRLQDILIPREAIVLENQIRRISFEVEQKLRELSDAGRKLFVGHFAELVKHYENGLDHIRQDETRNKQINQRVEQLQNLSPREFEEYVERLFKELGYERVTLTPETNDKGVDLLTRHKDAIVAIQCKKYRGKVGSPDVLSFLGAMRHAGAQKGYIVTTGVFSFEAEKMASDHPIELIDCAGLSKLIEQALKK